MVFGLKFKKPKLFGKSGILFGTPIPRKQIAIGIAPIATAGASILPALRGFGKAIIPKTLRGKVTASVLTLTGGTILAKSPKARKATKTAIPKIAKSPFVAGDIIAEVIETGKAPVSAKTALLTGGALAGAVVGGVAIAKGVKAVKEKALVPMGQLPAGIQTPDKQIIESPVGMKKEKAVKDDVATMPSIDIDINLTNKQSNKRFINTGAVVTR